MSFPDKVKALGLPLAEVIVIGSGLLDALGIRSADDIDLVVSAELFERLRHDSRFETRQKGDETYLVADEPKLEVCQNWGELGFDDLMTRSRHVDGVAFTSLEFIADWKRKASRPKDLEDLKLIEAYQRGN